MRAISDKKAQEFDARDQADSSSSPSTVTRPTHPQPQRRSASSSAALSRYSSSDLQGLAIAHDAGHFDAGRETILTLRDDSILKGDVSAHRHPHPSHSHSFCLSNCTAIWSFPSDVIRLPLFFLPSQRFPPGFSRLSSSFPFSICFTFSSSPHCIVLLLPLPCMPFLSRIHFILVSRFFCLFASSFLFWQALNEDEDVLENVDAVEKEKRGELRKNQTTVRKRGKSL